MATRRISETLRDDPSLSEVARHLILPAGIVSSGYPAVAATCARMGLTFDRWQAGAAKGILAKDAEGLYAADTSALSIPRQVGKTFLIGAIIFALCLIHPNLLVLWSAHRMKTARETFESMQAMASMPLVKRHVRQVLTASNNEQIIFHNGSRILFGARERGFGRGIPNVGVVVFDEAQILTSNAIDDMVPATNRAENPLILHVGTPPKPNDDGEHFATLRREAIKGESSDVFFVEISADADADPLDRAQWRKANPSYPKHTTDRAMLRMRKNLTAEAFKREALGIWDDDEKPSIMPAWPSRAVSGMPMPKGIVLAVASSTDNSRSSIAAVGAVSGVAHVGVVDRRKGTAWLLEELPRIQRERGDVEVWVRAKGSLKGLIDDLETAGVDVQTISEDAWVDACGDFARRVHEGGLIHAGHTALTRAVNGAIWRKVGARRAFAEQDVDISMLEAATIAVAAALDDYNVLDSIL